MGKQKIIDRLVLLIAVVAVAAAAYFYYNWNLLRQNPQAVAQQETTELVAKIGRLVVLPAEEVPTIATVSDPEALKDQTFFANSQKGDKVLIYAQAKKAVLYSVSLNKILGIAPLNIGEGQKAVTPPKPAATTTTETEI